MAFSIIDGEANGGQGDFIMILIIVARGYLLQPASPMSAKYFLIADNF